MHFNSGQFGGDYDAIGRGSAQPLFDIQLDVRDLLRAQTKTEWVIVSVGIVSKPLSYTVVMLTAIQFTSFVFEPMFGKPRHHILP
jgi:hypothetical protein